MKLANVSRYFNDDPIFDAYSGAYLFRAHTKAHDDQSSSGATSRRRTMRTAVGVNAPTRRAVKIDDSFWVMGNSNVDSFGGTSIRKSFGLKKSTGLMERLTPAQASLGQAGVSFHAHREFYRDTQNQLTEAELDVMWNIFCPFSEPMARGQFLRQGSRIYRIRSVYETVDEYLVAESDEFDDDAYQAITFTHNGTIDIATDTMATVTVNTHGVQTDQAKYYQFRDAAEADRQPGDRTVFIAQSVTAPKVSATITMLGVTWRVLAVVPELDAYALHVRR
jgi:hypothetical protein